MEFLNEVTVWYATLIVVVSILIDAILGIILTFKDGNEPFDFKKLPQFISKNIFPYVGGLLVIALAAEYIGTPYDVLFYPLAVAVLAKYVVEIKDKLQNMFGVDVK